jgi:hypothetical protein
MDPYYNQFVSQSRGSSGVEQLIRNQQVVGSIPILGSRSLSYE